MSRPGYKNGFTFVELAIVVLIIGLVVGGILVGQDLIRASALQKQIKQIKSYQAAFLAFHDKYNCFPGDCINATTYFGTTDSGNFPITNGNGNGVVDTENRYYVSGSGVNTIYNYTPGISLFNVGSSWGWEMQAAMQELAIAQMIDYSSPNTYQSHPFYQNAAGYVAPAVALNPSSAFLIGASYNFQGGAGCTTPPYYRLWGQYCSPFNILTNYQTGNNALWFIGCAPGGYLESWGTGCGVFNAVDLQAIDRKIDDGLPLSGNLFGFGGYDSTLQNNQCIYYNTTTPYVVSNPPNAYNVSGTFGKSAQCLAAYVIN